MKFIYEYYCTRHGKFESWSEPEQRYEFKPCPKCNEPATFAVSAATVKLPGWCDTFPSASLKWEERHIRESMKTPEPT